MKSKNILMLMLSTGLFIAGCNNGVNSTDAKKQADAENKKANVIDNADAKFMTSAASGGLMEVQAGNIALQRGISQEVKDFGQLMITDHGKANDDLNAMATSKNVVLPAVVSNDDQKKLDKLNKVDAKDFDKTYINMMIEDHNAAIDMFQKVVDNPKDADVKAWAQNTLPTLLHHLEQAKADKTILDK